MKRLIVTASPPLAGEITVPGDKSISHRAVLLGAMACGETVAEGWLVAEDCLHTLAAVEALGCRVQHDGTRVVVRSEGVAAWRPPEHVLDLGNSGTGLRLLLGALAGRPFEVTLDGDASLRRRPMDRVALPLGMMGAQVQGRGERCLPPVTVRGGALAGIEYEMPVASAQVKSALLLAGVQAAGRTAVHEPAPCRDHTERLLLAFGAPVEKQGAWSAVQGPAELQGCHLQVPGDFSSAAFVLAAAVLVPGSDVVLQGVGTNPTRLGFLTLLRAMGAQVETLPVAVEGPEPASDLRCTAGELRGTVVAGELVPLAIDELPLVAVLATQAEGETVVADAAELKVKESDRIAAMAEGLSAMGAEITTTPDGWTIHGPSRLHGATVHAQGDHRVAMALAVAGLVAEGETIIEGAEGVGTSFPEFVQVMQSLAARVKAE
ncbi:MAG: 3-phosphoshikimate 1-carboxyvinyltransferase [Armatimonadetes bacterium]|nr:3-phosphoshikimate 1-carboxyvinyltransferase [Armatimonadota bacterium]